MRNKFKVIFLLSLSVFLGKNQILASVNNGDILNSSNQRINKAFGRYSEEIHIIRDLKGHSKIVKFKLDKKWYVLRIFDETRPSQFYNTVDQEIDNMLKASINKTTPQIYYYDKTCIIMDFIENQPITPSKKLDGIFYKKLANLLKSIHSSTKFSGQAKDVFVQIEDVVNKVGYKNLPDIAQKVLLNTRMIKQCLKNDLLTTIPIHNELNFGNILFDRKNLYAIDWEVAGQGDPYLDLATVANFFIFAPSKENIFLNSYFNGKLSTKERAKFYLMKQVSLALYGFKVLRRIVLNEKFVISKDYINSLPTYNEFLEKIILNPESFQEPENFQKGGAIFLVNFLNNINSAEYQDAFVKLNCTFQKN